MDFTITKMSDSHRLDTICPKCQIYPLSPQPPARATEMCAAVMPVQRKPGVKLTPMSPFDYYHKRMYCPYCEYVDEINEWNRKCDLDHKPVVTGRKRYVGKVNDSEGYGSFR